jgi:hypothetical protein
VEDAVSAAGRDESTADAARIEDVALVLGHAVEVGRPLPDERMDFVPPSEERVNQVATEESRGAGDEETTHGGLLVLDAMGIQGLTVTGFQSRCPYSLDSP